MAAYAGQGDAFLPSSKLVTLPCNGRASFKGGLSTDVLGASHRVC
jgi:hypothetical protein